jgi:hypothetical protein
MDDRVNSNALTFLESLLSGLNRDQLLTLLLKLSEQDPSLASAIEKQVRLLQKSQMSTADRKNLLHQYSYIIPDEETTNQCLTYPPEPSRYSSPI